jgi:hypothetical protein
MTDQNETQVAMLKVVAIWAGTVFGGVTLSGLVLSATLIYTVLQIVVLVRKILKGQA